jgi:hypothetical protein
MKVATFRNGMELHLPTSGGKAGRGHNATSTFQIRRGAQIVKQIRFTAGDAASRKAAYEKVKEFIRNEKAH